MDILWLILTIWILVVVTWALYICSMQLKHHKQDLHPIAKFHAYILAGFTIALDFVLNIIASVPLLELPRWDLEEFLLSPRLKRIRENQGDTWRGSVASWICEHMLNQFDRSGDHC